MARQRYDIIFAGDFREPPFRTTTNIDQLKAATAAGYRTGFVQLTDRSALQPTRLNQDVRQLIDRNCLAQLDPNQAFSADLLIVAAPSCFIHRPRRFPTIDALHHLVLVPQGPGTATGYASHDWETIYRHTREFMTEEIIWAPMDPIVRDQLERLEPKPHLSDVDWYACVDPAEWSSRRFGFRSSRPIIGRSGPPSGQSWLLSADEILSLYPDDPEFLVRILNGGPYLKEQIGYYPRNWEMLTCDNESETEFLSSIDFFVYGHHFTHANRIDPALLRAMASGAVAILPPSFEPIFGDSVVYAEPEQVRSQILSLYANRARYLALSEAGTEAVKENFSPQSLITRIGDLIGPPSCQAESCDSIKQGVNVRAQRNRRRVMFITINGVGMGHLTRMLAIAKRCPEPIEPVFVTMSQALKVLRQQGYLAEFIPSRQYLKCDAGQWNNFLRDEINEMISFYDPAVVIFDGNVPYKGLLEAIKANPVPWFIWSRRGMWRSDNSDVVSRETVFDVVLEPGDIASADDHGITTRFRNRTHQVKPIRLLDSSEMLSREDARSELGLDAERPAVLIQLGAGNNYDYRSIHNSAIAHINERYDAQIAVGEWLISDQSIDVPPSVVRMPGYPFARYFKAFDFAISAVGYNSFHELLFSGVPTIFVPNEAMEQDNQLARALYADRQALAVCVRTKETYRLTAMIDKFFQSEERDRIKARLATLDPANGGAQAAELIDEMAYSLRMDRP